MSIPTDDTSTGLSDADAVAALVGSMSPAKGQPPAGSADDEDEDEDLDGQELDDTEDGDPEDEDEPEDDDEERDRKSVV